MLDQIVVSWSGGKDSALALYELQRSGDYEIHALLATLTEDYDRISMHGVRRDLLEQQVEALGYPLEQLFLSKDSSNEEYEERVIGVLDGFREVGVSSVAFGDIFLEDVRRYREERILSKVGMKGVFPLWKKDTLELARTFIDLDFKAVTTCVDSHHLGREFVGRKFDEDFLADLPSQVDPCGENGEFHSFVYDGPLYRRRIPYALGEVILREGRFYYC
ncbi:MAG: diphthine--ammonia ligase, partial [Dehalococcoidia bacterium]